MPCTYHVTLPFLLYKDRSVSAFIMSLGVSAIPDLGTPGYWLKTKSAHLVKLNLTNSIFI